MEMLCLLHNHMSERIGWELENVINLTVNFIENTSRNDLI